METCGYDFAKKNPEDSSIRSDWKQRVEPEKGKRAGKVKPERAQGDALALGAEEGRSDLRKATGS